MKTLNASTKQAQNFINAYNASDCTDIMQAYCRPSTRKTQADYLCRLQCAKEGGKGYRITAAGSFFFTVGWITKEGLRIETACNSYLIPEEREEPDTTEPFACYY